MKKIAMIFIFLTYSCISFASPTYRLSDTGYYFSSSDYDSNCDFIMDTRRIKGNDSRKLNRLYGEKDQEFKTYVDVEHHFLFGDIELFPQYCNGIKNDNYMGILNFTYHF